MLDEPEMFSGLLSTVQGRAAFAGVSLVSTIQAVGKDINAFGLQTDTDHDQKVQKAQSLKLIDSGDYEQSWDMALNMFKSRVSKDQWRKTIQTTRSPFGQVLSQKMQKVSYTDHLPDAPDGDFVVIQYETSFEHEKLH